MQESNVQRQTPFLISERELISRVFLCDGLNKQFEFDSEYKRRNRESNIKFQTHRGELNS